MRHAVIFLALAASSILLACSPAPATSPPSKEPAAALAPDSERPTHPVKVLQPAKPLKVKIKKTAKDEIVWEIEGGDLDQVVRATHRLKKEFP